LTCDESAAGYLKALYRTEPCRPEIIPLLARLIRWPITGVDMKFDLVNGAGHGEDRPRDRSPLLPGVEPGFARVLSRCGEADRVEFYVDPDPNSQLLMTLLLTQALAAGIDNRKLFLVHGPVRWGMVDAAVPSSRIASPIQVEAQHLKTAASVWSAYCAPTPERWLGLRQQDIALFPFLKAAKEALLDDLPRRDTGLGACERLALRSIGADGTTVNEVVGAFYREPTRLIDLPQIVALLSSLADDRAPLIDGLQGRLGPDDFYEDIDAWDAFRSSHVRLTEAGNEVLAGELDFIKVHGIDRWWGGTHLTGPMCWQWDPEMRTLTQAAER
jgi:hypothetical protein